MICPKCNTENQESAKFCQKCGNSLLVSMEKPSNTVGSETNVVNNGFIYAGFWQRTVAYLFDSFFIGLISGIFITCFGDIILYSSGLKNLYLINLITIISGLITSSVYLIFFWVHSNGQTPGKQIMHIKVVRENSLPIDLKTAIVRLLSYLISGWIFDVGFFWMLWDQKRQCWHDKLAKTLVIQTDDKTSGIKKFLIVIILLFVVLMALLIAGGIIFMGKERSKLNYSSNQTTAASTLIGSACTRLIVANQAIENPFMSDQTKQQLPSIYQIAITELKSAAQLEPNNPEPIYYLALTYKILADQQVSGSDKLAQEYLQKAIVLNPHIISQKLCSHY